MSTVNKTLKRLELALGIGLSALLISAPFVGCTKDISIEKEDPRKGEGYGSGEVKPGEDFDYATAHDAEVNILYNVPADYAVDFYIYKENPLKLNANKDYVRDTTLKYEMKGTAIKGGKASFTWKHKPDNIKEIYVYSPSSMVPRVVRANAEGKIIHITDKSENVVVRSQAVLTKGSPNGSYYTDWPVRNVSYQTIGGWNAAGVPDNLLSEKIQISGKVGQIIDATLPVEGDMNPANYLREYIHLSKDSNVKIYFYQHTSGRENALAYFTYSGDGTNIPDLAEINSHLVLLYPNLNSGLEQGEGIQLKYFDGKQYVDEFPAGTNIGFALLIDAFQNGQIDTKNVNVFYSPKRYNKYNMEYSTMDNRPMVGMFKADDSYVLAFEDQPWGQANWSGGGAVKKKYPADMRDDIFIVDANPIEALPDVPGGTDPETPEVSGIEIPHRGILAYEDLWPSKGDYDMNDVVVKYDLTDYFNLDEVGMTGLTGTVTFLHNGAQRKNGFGFELDANRTDVLFASVTSDYVCDGQGLDETAEKATLLLFENGKNVPAGTTFDIKVVYKKPVSSWGYKQAPYNPFIIINNAGLTRGNWTECHLVNYSPTEKANFSLLHSNDDLSDASRGIYYVSDSYFPFAIDLADAQDFIGAKESVRMDKEYPRFESWVMSGGKEDTDWYLKTDE